MYCRRKRAERYEKPKASAPVKTEVNPGTDGSPLQSGGTSIQTWGSPGQNFWPKPLNEMREMKTAN
jgi:hypothetical protein